MSASEHGERFRSELALGSRRIRRNYTQAIEGEAGGYRAYVPELPAVLVTGRSPEELTERARVAIRLYWETVQAEVSPASVVREIEVELPA